MRLDKQIKVMAALRSGYYEVDAISGQIWSIRKRGKILLRPNKLPSGYQQIVLFTGRGKGKGITIYLHEVVYAAWHGMYDETKEIDHLDRDKLNCSIYNLELKSSAGNKANSVRTSWPKLTCLRKPEIALIKQLRGKGDSQASIARQLGLNRLSVRYIIKRIEQGLPLKYE